MCDVANSLCQHNEIGTNPANNTQEVWCDWIFGKRWHNTHIGSVAKKSPDLCVDQRFLDFRTRDTFPCRMSPTTPLRQGTKLPFTALISRIPGSDTFCYCFFSNHNKARAANLKILKRFGDSAISFFHYFGFHRESSET